MPSFADIIRERAQKHFRAGSEVLLSIPVPEWPDGDDRPTIFYYKPLITLAEKQVISKQAKGDNVALVIETFIRRARDKDGMRIFKSTDTVRKQIREEFDSEIVERIVVEMYDSTEETAEFEEAEGNSEATASLEPPSNSLNGSAAPSPNSPTN